MNASRYYALSLYITLSAISLVACEHKTEEPRGKVAESVAPVVEEDTEESAQGAGVAPTMKKPLAYTEVAVNAAESKIQFVGAKITDKHEGGFKDFDGKLELGADGNLEMVAFTVRMDSMYSDHEKLTEHLKSSDFFDVALHPEASFESTAITAGSDYKTDEGRAYTHTVVGNMTIKGVTKPLAFPAMVDTSGDTITASTNFVFDRNIFDITYKGLADDLIRPEVMMSIDLQAPKPS